MLIVIGSVAQSYCMNTDRVPGDLDLVGSYDEIALFAHSLKRQGHKILAHYPIDSGKKVVIKTDGVVVEADITWPGSAAERLYEFLTEPSLRMYEIECMGERMLCPGKNVLYMLKMSHRYLKNSSHFLKTMRDIQAMRKAGAVIPEYMQDFYKQRMADTYNYAHPRLNQSKKEFFDNATDMYTLNHDHIHLAVMHLDEPAYEKFKPDSAEVMTSKGMFFSCSEEVRLLAGYEEAMTLSIERSIHPFPTVDRKWAFDTALMKLCTSISSGWFREYCWENYDKIQALYDVEYVDRFYAALAAGKIGKFAEG